MTLPIEIKTWPTLRSLSSTGKVKVWGVKVIQIEDKFYWLSSHGYEDSLNREETYSSPIKGKNIGRKNATTDQEQAILVAESKWQDKVATNYTETSSIEEIIMTVRIPMLAHKWSERKHNAVLPGYVQPKLNGVRALYDPSAPIGSRFTSKSGKPLSCLTQLETELDRLSFPPGIILDGELYCHELTFQQILTLVKKEREDSHLLEFHWFDIADVSLTFEQRLSYMSALLDQQPVQVTRLKLVPTIQVNSEEEFGQAQADFVSQRYEGTMFRNAGGKYIFNYRNVDLLKFKDFLDDEFEIVGGKSASGSDEDTIVFICKTKAGQIFTVRPVGSREFRKSLLEQIDSLVGKMLTVKYQNLSDDGVPIFPVGICVRDYE